MIVLGLGSCLIAITTLAAVALLDRVEANRRVISLRVL
ncbi:hypothetical protein GGD56_004455 [Rhizobium mongolense]|uniref:Uncharacterized protein n=1 Tax=Rhizobium mongolense TaxID=57676 RepID=A0ABR6IRR8_9HYPH|nr:hypothetical protein [Rhizobium mongolense]